MNNILVIGNGFDLAHGLPTSYMHFIEFVRSSLTTFEVDIPSDENMKELIDIAKHNGFIKYLLEYTKAVPGWVDLERLIREIIGEIETFVKNIDGYRHGNVFIQSRVSNNLSNILLWFEIRNKGTIQRVYINNTYSNIDVFQLKETYYHNVYGINIRELKRELREHLAGLIRILQIYLHEYLPLKCHQILPKQQIKDIEPSYVISFNYTDTYKVYGVDSKDVFHVHGSLENDNMVLGFDDDNPDELDFIYFKKYFQRIQKLTGYLDKRKFNTVNEVGATLPNNASVYFYGHSMDKTDGDMIRELRGLSKAFVIYTYNQEDYEQKVINLIEVFGKAKATDMIQNGFIRFVQCE